MSNTGDSSVSGPSEKSGKSPVDRKKNKKKSLQRTEARLSSNESRIKELEKKVDDTLAKMDTKETK